MLGLRKTNDHDTDRIHKLTRLVSNISDGTKTSVNASITRWLFPEIRSLVLRD